jgi:undecaprenyl-diphosphatase
LVDRVAVCEVAAVGFSRLYLGVHWLTAVLAGWLLAAAWLTLLFTSLQQFGPAPRDRGSPRSCPLQRTRSI